MIDNLVELSERLNERFKPVSISLPKKHTDIATLLFTYLEQERKQRPELALSFQSFPTLLTEYLTLDERDKIKLEEFRSSNKEYLSGKGKGDGIQYLVSTQGADLFSGRMQEYKQITNLVRGCRYANQIAMIFAFYQKTTSERRFNNNYIARDAQLKKEFGYLGNNLIANINNSCYTVQEIVDIVALTVPEIGQKYESPKYRLLQKKIAPVFQFRMV